MIKNVVAFIFYIPGVFYLALCGFLNEIFRWIALTVPRRRVLPLRICYFSPVHSPACAPMGALGVGRKMARYPWEWGAAAGGRLARALPSPIRQVQQVVGARLARTRTKKSSGDDDRLRRKIATTAIASNQHTTTLDSDIISNCAFN